MKLLFPSILLLAFALRVFWLDKLPVGFTPDEASFGYDAYSILKTGADQWGHTFPLVLESFGDYKAPLYSYLTIPFVGLLGLNKVAVRLPNALLGTAAVYITYLLVRELRRLSEKKLEFGNWSLEIIASSLLAISPWHIMMSRGAFEANLTTFFLPLGIYLFLRGINKAKFLSWSALVFGLNLFSYHSAKLVTPLMVALLMIIFRNRIKKIQRRKILPAVFIFGFFLTLTAYTFSLGAGGRVVERSIFQGALQEASVARFAKIQKGTPIFVARLLHNKYQVTLKRFLNNYGSYFSAKFLFNDGPKEATYGMIPQRGVLYWFEMPLLFGFLIALFKKKYPLLSIIAYWLIFAPIPASLSTGVGYAANRAVIALPAFSIAEAYGGIYLYQKLKKVIAGYFRWVVVACLAIVLVFLLAFIKDYVGSAIGSAEGMLYGNLEAAYWLAENAKGSPVLVSKKLSEPHIYIAFANSWNPTSYQKAVKSWNYKAYGINWVDQMPEYKLGNYTFKGIEWEKDSARNAYLVGKPDEFPETVTADVIISYPGDKPAIFIFKPTINKYAQKIY